MGTGTLAGFAYIVLTAASLAAGAPVLYELPGSSTTGYELSGDGTLAVGQAIWTAAQGVTSLPIPFVPTAASMNGSYIAGYQNVNFIIKLDPLTTASINQPVRWGANGTTNLGDLDTSGLIDNKFGRAHGISADGSVVVGETGSLSNRQAFRWTTAGGMVGLGVLAGDSYSRAVAVSANGAVVVGNCPRSGAPAMTDHGFRWTAATGLVPIPDLPGGFDLSAATAISADGATIVGYSSSTASATGTTGAMKAEAYRWTAGTGTVALGDLAGGDYYSFAEDVSGNGGTVVGWSFVAPDARGLGVNAFIWDQAHGMRNLQKVLETDYAMDLGGWTLSHAKSISDDGNVITGLGLGPDNIFHSWVITLVPEPTCLAPLAAVTLLFRRRRAVTPRARTCETPRSAAS